MVRANSKLLGQPKPFCLRISVYKFFHAHFPRPKRSKTHYIWFHIINRFVRCPSIAGSVKQGDVSSLSNLLVLLRRQAPSHPNPRKASEWGPDRSPATVHRRNYPNRTSPQSANESDQTRHLRHHKLHFGPVYTESGCRHLLIGARTPHKKDHTLRAFLNRRKGTDT